MLRYKLWWNIKDVTITWNYSCRYLAIVARRAGTYIFIIPKTDNFGAFTRNKDLLRFRLGRKNSRFTWVNIARAFSANYLAGREIADQEDITLRTNGMKQIAPGGPVNILFIAMENACLLHHT